MRDCCLFVLMCLFVAAAAVAAPTSSSLSPDLNTDGTVDGADLAALLAAWGTTPAAPRMNESDAIVHTDGVDVWSVDGETGFLVAGPGTDAGVVINDTIACYPDGAVIYVTSGDYTVDTVIDFDGASGFTLVGPSTATLTNTAGTIILIQNDASHIAIRGLTFENGDRGINLHQGDDILIDECTFRNMDGRAMQGHISGDDGNFLERIRVTNNTVQDCDTVDPAAGAGAAVYFYFLRDSLVTGNLVERSGNLGIHVARSSRRVVIASNISRDNDQNSVSGQGHGLYVSSNFDGASEIIVVGNQLVGNGGNGLEALSGTIIGSRMVISDNVFSGNGFNNNNEPATNTGWRTGAFVTGSYVVVSDNLVEGNYGTGLKLGFSHSTFDVLVTGNVVANNGLGASDPANAHFSSGISSGGSGAGDDQRILITGNHVTDSIGLQKAAINVQDGGAGVTIENNLVDGVTTPLIKTAGAGPFVIRRNTGFVTESSGSATVSDDGTAADDFFDVTHGLDLTPGVSDIQVTPTSSLGGRDFWIDSVGATTFRINVSDGSGTVEPDVSFSWRCQTE